jgi:hypothetical protein
MADDWRRWRENRAKPGVAPAPWVRTIAFLLLFPLFFPLQFTNWLALVVAPKPKWPKELDALHQADLNPRRKPVIRVNGEIVSGDERS